MPSKLLSRRPRLARRTVSQKTVDAMYADYQQGKSLAEVGEAFNVTRQCVYKIFAIRGLKMRRKTRLPAVQFNGRTYSATGRGGYYRQTDGKRGLMHRHVWEFYNGPIPDGWDIHHIDECKANNAIGNLECLPKSEHTRLYSPHNNKFTRGQKRRSHPVKTCVHCGTRLTPKIRPSGTAESPAEMQARNFCGYLCVHAWKRGRPKTSKAGA